MTDTELAQLLEALAVNEGGEMWQGRPERWWDDPHWRCVNDHVSITYLKSEAHGAQCLAANCRRPLHLTFPEDADGPLTTRPRQVCLDGHPLDANGLDPRQPLNPWPATRPATSDDPL